MQSTSWIKIFQMKLQGKHRRWTIKSGNQSDISWYCSNFITSSSIRTSHRNWNKEKSVCIWTLWKIFQVLSCAWWWKKYSLCLFGWEFQVIMGLFDETDDLCDRRLHMLENFFMHPHLKMQIKILSISIFVFYL